MKKKRYLVIVGIVLAAVLLSILGYRMLANHRPVITSLEAEPEIVILSGTCQIVCSATDPDGDELNYGWSASGGGITEEGATVTWTAPDSVGSYNVTVTVNDSHGSVVTGHATITVRDNKPPIIDSVIADADQITPSGTVWIRCNATDPDGDELSYQWLPYGGGISGTGATVKWIAPEAAGAYGVLVVVTDGYGGSAMSGVGIDVSSTELEANGELEQVKTAALGYFGEYGYWPDSSDDLVMAGFIFSGMLRAVYTFDMSYGWVIGATPNAVDGWTGIVFSPGVAGPTGHHGTWVKL